MDSFVTRIPKAPFSERIIKMQEKGGSDLQEFINSSIAIIDNAYDFTTIYLDTEEEMKKYNLSIPGVMLICTDLRKTVASLKRDGLVLKFNKSKTLKRVAEWSKIKVDGFDKLVWASIYVSAKEFRDSKSEPLPLFGDATIKYFGYLDTQGNVFRKPVNGEMVLVNEIECMVTESFGDLFIEDELFDETEINEMVELDIDPIMGENIDGLTVLGTYEGRYIVSDKDDNCYILG